MMKLGLLAGFTGLLAASAVHAQTFSNSRNTTDIPFFGQGHTTAYGQVFTAPSVGPGVGLLSWSFLDTDTKSNGTRFVVAAWNGNDPVGPALYDSLSETVAATNLTATSPLTVGLDLHTYGNIDLALTAGQQYIAYITVAGVANPANITEVSGSTGSPLGGAFRFLNSGGADPLSPAFANQGWDFTPTFPDLFYSAKFGLLPPSAAPEPATWVMAIAGLFAVGGVLRRRRHGLRSRLA